MKRFNLILFSILSMMTALAAWLLYFVADTVAKYSTAFDQAADHYHNKVLQGAK
jgi:hypothetical protein